MSRQRIPIFRRNQKLNYMQSALMPTEKEILVEAKAIFTDYKRWCKGHDRKNKAYAKDALGNYVSHDSPEAVRWTILGAVMLTMHRKNLLYNNDDLWFDLNQLMGRVAHTFGFMCEVGFNDSPNTKFMDIMKFFDKAIKEAE